MNFDLTEDQRELQAAARRFARGELLELARELERNNEPVSHQWRRRYAKLGYLGINLPERHGGMGLGHLEALLVLEEFAQVSPAVAFRFSKAPPGRCGRSSTSHRRI